MPIHEHILICGDTLYSLLISHHMCKHSYWQLLLIYTYTYIYILTSINIYKHHPTYPTPVLSCLIHIHQSYHPNKRQQNKQHNSPRTMAKAPEFHQLVIGRMKLHSIMTVSKAIKSFQARHLSTIEVRPVIVVEPQVAKEPPKKKWLVTIFSTYHLIIHILHISVPIIYGRLIFIALASEVVWLPQFAGMVGESSNLGEWPSGRSWVDEPQHRSRWSCWVKSFVPSWVSEFYIIPD